MFNPQAEAMPGKELRKLQGERLKALVARAYENVPFYRAKFDAQGVKPGDIRGSEDVATLPFTLKPEVREPYPFGMFAAPMKDIVRIQPARARPEAHGGGLHEERRRQLGGMRGALAGLRRATAHDVVQIAYGYGLFTGGLGMHYGAERLGAAALPMSSGNTEKQIMLMKDFGVTVLCCTPSYALQIAEVAAQMGEDLLKLPLKSGHFGAEPGRKRCASASRNFSAEGAGHLRALRGRRAGRRQRMPRAARPARVRGPFLSGNHRPGNGRPAAGRPERRTGLHLPD
jgi:phenylacetate-CoA ligase